MNCPLWVPQGLAVVRTIGLELRAGCSSLFPIPPIYDASPALLGLALCCFRAFLAWRLQSSAWLSTTAKTGLEQVLNLALWRYSIWRQIEVRTGLLVVLMLLLLYWCCCCYCLLLFVAVRSISGHKAAICSMDFHRYGDILASGSMDTNLKVKGRFDCSEPSDNLEPGVIEAGLHEGITLVFNTFFTSWGAGQDFLLGKVACGYLRRYTPAMDVAHRLNLAHE